MVQQHNIGKEHSSEKEHSTGKEHSLGKEHSSGKISGTGNGKIAIVLVRGKIGLTVPSKDTLTMLNLIRKNNCVVVDDTPLIRGMLQKVKDYITWGDLTEEIFQTLVEKRGKVYEARLTDRNEAYQYNYRTIQGKHYKNYFALNPPRKGFGRKGIKIAFRAGGALGDRKEKINDLILRMV